MKKTKKILSIIVLLIFAFVGFMMQLDDEEPARDTTSPTVHLQQVQETGEEALPLSQEESVGELDEQGTYTSKDEVALYLHLYGKLPSNFITKKQAQKLGWEGGDLWQYAKGKSIGGDHFGNYEGVLPEHKDFRECDIDYHGGKRSGKRIVFSDDGCIYYTGDHYESFELLYGEE